MDATPYPWEISAEPILDDALEATIPKYPFDPESGTKASQQRRWEHKIVGKLLEHLGAADIANEIVAAAKDQTGQGRLSMEAFRATFPNFPVWLTARKIPYVHKTTWEDLKRFDKTKIYKAYVDTELDLPDGWDNRTDKTGLVFEWLHSPWTIAIVHNDYKATTVAGVTMRIIVNGEDLALQSLEAFLCNSM